VHLGPEQGIAARGQSRASHLGPEQGIGGGNRSRRVRSAGRRSNYGWPTGEAEQGVGGGVPGSGGLTNGSGGPAGEAEQGPRAGRRGGARTALRRRPERRRSAALEPAAVPTLAQLVLALDRENMRRGEKRKR
jgi:hypothetical protein